MKSVGLDGALRAFCDKHIPVSFAINRSVKLIALQVRSRNERDSDTASNFSNAPAIRGRAGGWQGDHSHNFSVTTKSARAHAKSYRPGPPIVPFLITRKLLEYVAKVSIRKRQPFIERLCRYWSLKREARRGAPLLKRLHLEVCRVSFIPFTSG